MKGFYTDLRHELERIEDHQTEPVVERDKELRFDTSLLKSE